MAKKLKPKKAVKKPAKKTVKIVLESRVGTGIILYLCASKLHTCGFDKSKSKKSS